MSNSWRHSIMRSLRFSRLALISPARRSTIYSPKVRRIATDLPLVRSRSSSIRALIRIWLASSMKTSRKTTRVRDESGWKSQRSKSKKSSIQPRRRWQLSLKSSRRFACQLKSLNWREIRQSRTKTLSPSNLMTPLRWVPHLWEERPRCLSLT